MSDTIDVAAATAPARDGASLQIGIRTGRGTGPTMLAAFDDALRQAGIANRNLVPLSSIIPAGAVVERREGSAPCPGVWGDRLYVVLATEQVEKPHEEAWAGVGWCQDRGTDAGMFVEHHGHSEMQVRADLESTLSSMAEARPDHDWGPTDHEVVGITCELEPVCALVVATYTAESWAGPTVDLRDGAG